MKIVFATNNAHKLREVARELGDSYTLLTPRDCGVTEDIPENEPTLEGNALAKARYIRSRTGLDCFADEPGVRSARYATDGHDDEANKRLLLERMASVDDRSARFRTAIALIAGDEEILFEGVVRGAISREEMGSNGFGYDPIFVPEGFDRSFAQMTDDEKNAVSHRGRAVRKLVDYLRER